ncbi:cysteine--tRNA ligase [Candidatus Babeliales bacterium]|nr:cysteine--tRNA ligase [Candidatus Babeliales bacterium]
MDLKLTNTFGRKKELFKPFQNNKVKMYVCGITPYDYSHVGHGRSYVNFDVLYRTLKFLGYDVIYVRNITDIDDKLLKRAQKELGDKMKYKEIAEKYTEYYDQDMDSLNCLRPDIEPKATEHITQMINFVKSLIEKKHAYIINSDVYFEVQSFPKYGNLSGKKLDDLMAGARIVVDKRKKHPADFVLWKGNDNKEFWKTDWGYGRPGWHLECSVMAREYLGDTIDIHGGGVDLIFPHNENEIAQAESFTGKTFVRYWIHNEFINVNKEKMSKSLGNFFTLRVIFKEIDPMILRFFFLQHHYRMPIEFSLDVIMSSKAAYKRLANIFLDDESNEKKNLTLDEVMDCTLIKSMFNALCDDMNTPKVLGILFENIDEIKGNKNIRNLVKIFLRNILGLIFKPVEKDLPKVTPEIENLIKKREQARKENDWKLADEIREQLRKIGYEIQDEKIEK